MKFLKQSIDRTFHKQTFHKQDQLIDRTSKRLDISQVRNELESTFQSKAFLYTRRFIKKTN